MNYYIGKDNQQLGPFTVEQVRQGLDTGAYQPTDLAWCESMTDWQPLASIPEFSQAAAPANVGTVAAPPVSAAAPARPRMTAPAPQMALPPRNSGAAIASLILGILSLFCSLLASIPAIICGHVALSNIRKSGGALGGGGMAIAGLVMGYVFTLILIPIMLGMAFPAYNAIRDKANQTTANSNCRQIIMGMKIYAADHNGVYPDTDLSNPQSANEVFRVLFKEECIEDEKIFGCPASCFRPDGLIGVRPDYSQALEAGENHWAMTRNVTDSSPGDMPLIYEDPAEATWPPTWNASIAGEPKPGRAWKLGKILVGRNDISVNTESLASTSGASVTLKSDAEGKNLFTRAADQAEVLDVLE